MARVRFVVNHRVENLELNVYFQSVAALMDYLREIIEQQRRVFLRVVAGNHTDEPQQIAA